MGNCFKQLFRKIFPQKTDLDFPPTYISNRFIMERVNNGPILVIGDYTGRDFLPLKKEYPDTYLLDIVDNKITDDHFVLQSITEPTSFGDETFQYVVMAEVIEHLWEDVAALKEVHRLWRRVAACCLPCRSIKTARSFTFGCIRPKLSAACWNIADLKSWKCLTGVGHEEQPPGGGPGFDFSFPLWGIGPLPLPMLGFISYMARWPDANG